MAVTQEAGFTRKAPRLRSVTTRRAGAQQAPKRVRRGIFVSSGRAATRRVIAPQGLPDVRQRMVRLHSDETALAAESRCRGRAAALDTCRVWRHRCVAVELAPPSLTMSRTQALP